MILLSADIQTFPRMKDRQPVFLRKVLELTHEKQQSSPCTVAGMLGSRASFRAFGADTSPSTVLEQNAIIL